MTNTLVTPLESGNSSAKTLLEEARAAHENYLIKQQDADLERLNVILMR